MSKSPFHLNFTELAKILTEFGRLLGPDTLIFSVVAIGTFTALTSGVDALITLFITIIILGGWLANRWQKAYFQDQTEIKKLERLKLERGVNLSQEHYNKIGSNLMFLKEGSNHDRPNTGTDNDD
jgi:hypothetical protein